MQYKEGDRVILSDIARRRYSIGGTPIVGTVQCDCSPWSVAWDSGTKSNHPENELTPVSNKKTNMGLIDKMALVFKGEPEKSFIKAGVMNTDETLTKEGEAVFLAYLLKANGADFKTKVVDPILADEDAKA